MLQKFQWLQVKDEGRELWMRDPSTNKMMIWVGHCCDSGMLWR